MSHPIVEEDLRAIAGADLPWSDLAGQTVLISGASGFLPAYMVETLLHLNSSGRLPPIHVIGLERLGERARARFAPYAGRSDLELLVQDVCDPIRIEGPVHTIIHAASQASPKFFGTDPVGTLKANTLGTYNLLELAREKKAGRFLFFSSGEVYGLMDEARMPVPEDYSGPLDSTDVRSCYAESKRLGETMCVSYLHQYGVPARIVRPFHTYGPGLSLSDGRVFADFVADVVAGRDIVLRSSGDARRAFCYLADATEAFFTVLLKGTPGQAYNVGNDRAEISIRDLAELVAGLLPDRRVKVVRHEEPSSAGYLPSAVTRALPDVSKIAQLGWRPTTGLEEGFRRTIRSFL